MILSIIVAIDENNGISWKNQLPWHLPAELKLFKQTTQNHHLLMGRKTFESVGKPLPGRTTIVVTRQRNYQPEGCIVTHNVKEGIATAQARGETELFVCGGKQIYMQTFSLSDRIYMTIVHARIQADLFLPGFDTTGWQEINSQTYEADEKNIYAFTRKIFVKRFPVEVDKP